MHDGGSIRSHAVATSVLLGVAFLTLIILSIAHASRASMTRGGDSLLSTSSGLLFAFAIIAFIGCITWAQLAPFLPRHHHYKQQQQQQQRRAQTVLDDGVSRSQSGGISTNSLADHQSASSSPPLVHVNIETYGFEPKVATVTLGTTVRWTNRNAVSQTVTSNDKKLDSEFLNQGDTYEHTFTDAGVYEYKSEISAALTGKIIVRR